MSKAHRPKEVILNLDQGRRSLKAVPGKNSALSVASAVSLGEHPGEYLVFVAVPGMERKDFSVTIINKKLVVSAVKKEAWHKFDESTEQFFSEWKETFILPDDADTVMTAAIYKNGELEIHIPRGRDDHSKTPVEVVVY